ncbi:flagellin [Aliiroseovarius sp.]|uniref:flagellin n=1 Tax=Aliiroseovarius sp. TaxID=1872442 RepID=UPI0026306039|nr:flagellin [Aliiroseovarius sp.]
MSNLTIGDMVGTFQTQRLTRQLKAELTRLSTELTTGVRENTASKMTGDFGPIAGIERTLKALDAYRTATSEAAIVTDTVQLSLEYIQTTNQELVPGLLQASSARNSTLIQTSAIDAEQKFASVVSHLNTRLADRTLMAGAATDGPALAGADTIMAALVAGTSGATTAADVSTAVDAWFDAPGGGFETLGYLGSTSGMGLTRIGDGDLVRQPVRADDQALRDVMKSYAKSALIAEGVLTGDVDEQAALTKIAAEGLLTADGALTTLRAQVGAQQARIEDISVQNAAERSALEIARADLIGADPYDTATELEAVYGQIETLYTVTARIAQLNFTDYM